MRAKERGSGDNSPPANSKGRQKLTATRTRRGVGGGNKPQKQPAEDNSPEADWDKDRYRRELKYEKERADRLELRMQDKVCEVMREYMDARQDWGCESLAACVVDKCQLMSDLQKQEKKFENGIAELRRQFRTRIEELQEEKEAIQQQLQEKEEALTRIMTTLVETTAAKERPPTQETPRERSCSGGNGAPPTAEVIDLVTAETPGTPACFSDVGAPMRSRDNTGRTLTFSAPARPTQHATKEACTPQRGHRSAFVDKGQAFQTPSVKGTGDQTLSTKTASHRSKKEKTPLSKRSFSEIYGFEFSTGKSVAKSELINATLRAINRTIAHSSVNKTGKKDPAFDLLPRLYVFGFERQMVSEREVIYRHDATNEIFAFLCEDFHNPQTEIQFQPLTHNQLWRSLPDELKNGEILFKRSQLKNFGQFLADLMYHSFNETPNKKPCTRETP